MEQKISKSYRPRPKTRYGRGIVGTEDLEKSFILLQGQEIFT